MNIEFLSFFLSAFDSNSLFFYSSCEEISLASIIRKNIPRDEREKKRFGHKIDIIFRVDDMEYFGAETFIDEDPHNSKPISYKYKLFREMKDQLDRLLKRLKFTEETIKRVRRIVLHGISHGGNYRNIEKEFLVSNVFFFLKVI